jgi:uncharacterized protein YbcC (UPF0753/DUF2309 family)
MKTNDFNLNEVLHELEHYLPSQAPLKDFIHHNTLHAFQHDHFDEALAKASEIFGYKVFLPLLDYRKLFKDGKIKEEILDKVIIKEKGLDELQIWKDKLIEQSADGSISKRIGQLRYLWRSKYRIDLEIEVKPILYKILNSYLDQGIAIWKFPGQNKGLIAAIRSLESNSFSSFFKTSRARDFLIKQNYSIESLLKIIVGDPALYEQYLFDQQFSHAGWSGMVSVIEHQPETLLDPKKIKLKELIALELLLEIDNLDAHFGEHWAPLNTKQENDGFHLFDPIPYNEYRDLQTLWQKAYEWTFYNSVLSAVQLQKKEIEATKKYSFQALFCIDDRECSIRRHIETEDPNCITYGTPGHFGLDMCYQPKNGKFITKVCPAPVLPKFLIKEEHDKSIKNKELTLMKRSHHWFGAWMIAQTVGFWSAIKLFFNVFKPSVSPFTSLSFNHMQKDSKLSILNEHPEHIEHGLQVGFTFVQMADKVEALLRSIDLIDNFAPLVYVMAHGSSSVNNTYYAGYDCGACSGRPGSVNARTFADIANRPEVRRILKERGIHIAAETQFVGALQDTSRDEIMFYDEDRLSLKNIEFHKVNEAAMGRALDMNAKERARRFESITSDKKAPRVHQKVKERSISLFEPRPELNHATNSLCIVGERYLTEKVFLDRRAFLNSYHYANDMEGKYLEGILNAVAPVCGGINLEYYFSRVDNERLGAGSKLPHNVMGLIGVANGIDGDLQTGLPTQMVEVHEPLRLMAIVEHYPEVIIETIKRNPGTYEWFYNKWLYLVAIHPETKAIYVFENGEFIPYDLVPELIPNMQNMEKLFEKETDNLPISLLQKQTK